MSGKTKIQVHSLPNISPVRKRLFWMITCLISFLSSFGFEIALRLFHYGGNPNLFVSIPNESSKYFGMNLEVTKRHCTTLTNVSTSGKDIFLKGKAEKQVQNFYLR